MKRRIALLLTVAAVLPCVAANKKIAPDLAQMPPGSNVDVIVQFTSPPSELNLLNLVGSLLKGGLIKTVLSTLNAVVMTVTSGSLDILANRPDVVYISPDRTVKGQLDYVTTAVGADLAWKYGWSGNGVGIAVIDSGISDSKDLHHNGVGFDRIAYSENFTKTFSLFSTDGYGHGTHVAGIAAGDGFASGGRWKGVAPKANLIDLRVLDNSGAGSESAVLAAIARAIQLKNLYNIRVLNLSLGRPVYESYQQDPLCQAVEAAWKAGIVVVVAAGNNGRDNTYGNQGYSTINSPANDPYVITVGAMKAMDTYSRGDDLIASYSSKGPTAIDHFVKPDLVAPGNLVVSNMGSGTHTLAQTYPQNVVSGTYFRLSGTSMAAPVVSGAAALLLEKTPRLTPDQVKARLMKTASKTFPQSSSTYDQATGQTYVSTYDVFTVGAGYLDIVAALNNTDLATKPALSPAATFNTTTGTATPVAGSSALWGSSAMWGTSAIWGSSAMWGTSALWGSSAMWGTSVIWGDSALWGSSSNVNGESITAGGER